MKVRIGIHDDLFANNPLQIGNHPVFLSVKKTGNLRIDFESQSDSLEVTAFLQYFPVNIVTDRLLGRQIPFPFAIVSGFAQNPGQRLLAALAGHLYKAHFRHG